MSSDPARTLISQFTYYCMHGDFDPDPNPDWLHLHKGILVSNPDSDHLTHVDCAGARANMPI